MRRQFAFGLLLGLLSGCTSAAVPDHIPPPPPERLDVVRVSEAADEPTFDGFGGDGFGGVTPTINVEESDVEESAVDETASEETSAEEASAEEASAEEADETSSAPPDQPASPAQQSSP